MRQKLMGITYLSNNDITNKKKDNALLVLIITHSANSFYNYF